MRLHLDSISIAVRQRFGSTSARMPAGGAHGLSGAGGDVGDWAGCGRATGE